MPIKTPSNLIMVSQEIAKILSGYSYAIRGTASLVLQGFDMVALDIDILCDANTALKCNDLFSSYIVSQVIYAESDKFKSYFGKLSLDGVPVEIMGELQIKDTKGLWSDKFIGDNPNILLIDGVSVKVTKPEDELKMFALMGRWNAFHKLKRLVGTVENSSNKENNQKSFFDL